MANKMTLQEFDEAVVDAYGCEMSAPMEIRGVALVIRNFLPESDFLGINEFSAWMNSLIKIAYRAYINQNLDGKQGNRQEEENSTS